MNYTNIQKKFRDETILAIQYNLVRFRFYAGLTQKDLGKKSGVTQGRISALEQGRDLASPPLLKLLATALDCEIKDIIQPPKRDREARSTSDSALE